MAGGYSGQLVALDVDTPSELEDQAATAALANTQSQLAQQTMPSTVSMARSQAQAAQMANQSNKIDLDEKLQFNMAKQRYLANMLGQNSGQASQGGGVSSPSSSQLSVAGDGGVATSPAASYFSPAVDAAVKNYNPSDPDAAAKWHDAMFSAYEDGDETAKQFIGNVPGADQLKNWQSAIGAQTTKSNLEQFAQPQQAPQSQLAQGAAQPGQPDPAIAVNPNTGNVDPDMLTMSVINPAGAAQIQSMRAQMLYQQTGDSSILRRYAPEVYEKLTEADKNTTDTQKEALATRFSAMGQTANAIMIEADQVKSKGGNPDSDPAIRGMYNQAITEFAQRGWLDPNIAKQELAAPNIDFAKLEQFRNQSMTVGDWFKASGTEAANEAAAKQAYPAYDWKTVHNVDGTDSLVRVGGPNTSVAPSASSVPASLQSFAQQVNGFENGGNATGSNPNSSASGGGQFLNKTWLGLMKSTRPDLTAGKSDADILAMRNDPAISSAMTITYAQQNGQQLQAMGVPVTGATLGAAHNVGMQNLTKILHSSPNEPLADILSPQVIAANPQFKNQTAGGYIAHMTSVYGNNPIALTNAGQTQGGATVVATGQGDNAGVESQAQAIANGTAAPLTGRAGSAGLGSEIMARVYQINPKYDASVYEPRVKTLESFTSGKDSATVQSLNNATQHLAQLGGMVDALNNGDNHTLNRIGNLWAQEFGGTAPTDFSAVKQMVAGELTKVIAGGAGGEGDRQQAAAWLDSANSPVQLKSAIEKVKGLLGSQFHTLQNKYQVGTGRNDFEKLVLPDVRNAWGSGAQQMGGQRPQAQLAGPTATGPNGQKVQWNGRQWAPMGGG